MNAVVEIERQQGGRLTAPPNLRRRPWIAGILAVLGLGFGIWWGLAINFGMLGRISAFERAPIPSGHVAVTSEPGTKVLYVELSRDASTPNVRFSVADPSGRTVEVRTYEGDLRYDVPDQPGRIGRAVATFEADTEGTYSIEINGLRTEGAVVAIGDDVSGPAIAATLGVLALLSISTIGGLVLLGRWLDRRRGRNWL